MHAGIETMPHAGPYHRPASLAGKKPNPNCCGVPLLPLPSLACGQLFAAPCLHRSVFDVSINHLHCKAALQSEGYEGPTAGSSTAWPGLVLQRMVLAWLGVTSNQETSSRFFLLPDGFLSFQGNGAQYLFTPKTGSWVSFSSASARGCREQQN